MTSQSDIDSIFFPHTRSCENREKHCEEQCKKFRIRNKTAWLVWSRAGALFFLPILLFALLSVFEKTLPASEESKPESADSESQIVFSAMLRSIDSFLNYVDQTLIADADTKAHFRAERLTQTQLYTADGSDFSRPIGLIVKTDGKTLLPYYFFPVKENVRRLNNIILLPQIYLPIKDEYGPTNRYQVRQDIPVLGGFHVFYWPLEPLLAQEQNGWIWVTTAKGFDRLPKEPLDLLPDFHWNEGELFQMKFNAQHLSQELGDGLLQLARAVVCDAPKAMWSEKKVGPSGAQWGNICYQYALRVLHGTQSLKMSCAARKSRMTFTLDWQIDPQSEWAKLFRLQVDRVGKHPTLDSMYPHKNVPEAFKNILLTDEEQKLIQTIQAARKVSHMPEWFWSFTLPEQIIRDGQRQGLATENLKFTPQSCSLVADIAGAFFSQRLSTQLRSQNEEQKKKQEEKKKRKKIDQFDITF